MDAYPYRLEGFDFQVGKEYEIPEAPAGLPSSPDANRETRCPSLIHSGVWRWAWRGPGTETLERDGYEWAGAAASAAN